VLRRERLVLLWRLRFIMWFIPCGIGLLTTHQQVNKCLYIGGGILSDRLTQILSKASGFNRQANRGRAFDNAVEGHLYIFWRKLRAPRRQPVHAPDNAAEMIEGFFKGHVRFIAASLMICSSPHCSSVCASASVNSSRALGFS
jgi:hypothetical protein